MNAPIRIIGIGSPFGDDRCGLAAAQALAGLFDPALVEVFLEDRPGARIVALMRGAQLVVLVDAVKGGAAPGSLCRLEGATIRPALGRHTSTHGFGVAEALQLAEKLGEAPPNVVLWGIESGDGCEGISPAASQGLPALVDAVAGEVGAALRRLGLPQAELAAGAL